MKNKIPIKILAHGIDPDGIISHTLLERYHLGQEIEHWYLDYPDLFPKLVELSNKNCEPSIVYIADLNYTKKLVEDPSIIQKIKKRNESVAWFDHHSSSIKNEKIIRQYCDLVEIDKDSCTAKIILEKYMQNSGEYDKNLAKIAFLHDYEIKSDELYQTGVDLQDIISYRRRSSNPRLQLDQLVKNIVQEQAFNNDGQLYQYLLEEAENFREEKKSAYKQLEQTVTNHIIKRKKIVASFSDDILYMKPAPEHLRTKFEGDYFLVMFNNEVGSCMLYANPETVTSKEVVDICSLLGGGGRGYGGGFILKKKIDQECYQNNRDKILGKIKEYLTNN